MKKDNMDQKLTRAFSETLRVGQIMAILDAHLSDGLDIEAFIKKENLFILDELSRYFMKETRPQKSPSGACNSDKPFLKDNYRYFLYHILSKHNDAPWEAEKNRLIHHLNSCYWCFTIYGQVMRDFHWTKNNINSFMGG